MGSVQPSRVVTGNNNPTLGFYQGFENGEDDLNQIIPPLTMENPPSSPQEPTPKKPKMSTTSDDDTTAATTTDTADRKPRYKRRKIALFFAYCGVGYQGMQKNPGAKTIEGELEEALFHCGAVPEQDRGNPKRYDWARSARTDKGVSAVGQVISGRFYIDPPGLVERLNSTLPAQIRIFGYKRVTAAFSAKKFCDRRRYLYLIPVFALDPCSHPDRESVLASLGSGNELVKCLKCSERGRKVEGVMGKRSFESNSLHSETIVESGISSNNGNATLHSEANEEIGVPSNNDNAGNSNGDPLNEPKVDSNNGVSEIVVETSVSVQKDETTVLNVESIADSNAAGEVEASGEEKVLKESEFHYGEKERERFNRILKHYEGTHNFHNFTTRIKAEDPSAQRYIISFQANETVEVEGIEFVKCEVVGQSFMLHQIRKLIGMAVAVMRNCAPESLIETALQRGVNITVPTAPEVGLYLDECFFTSYNQKWKDTHEEVSMKDYVEEAEAFKMKNIYSHIASTEHKEGAVALWLHSLNYRNYPDLRVVNNGDATDKTSAEVEKMVDNGDATDKTSDEVEKMVDSGDATDKTSAEVGKMAE